MQGSGVHDNLAGFLGLQVQAPWFRVSGELEFSFGLRASSRVESVVPLLPQGPTWHEFKLSQHT